MTSPEPTPATTARATPEIRRLLSRSAAGVVIAGAIVLTVGIIWPPARPAGILAALASLAYAAYAIRYVRRALVEFGGGRYRIREALDDVTFTAPDVAVVVPVDELVLPGQAGPALVVIGTSGRRLAEINASGFGRATLEALANDLIAHGARLDPLTGRVTPAEFARRHPGVLSWSARHPLAPYLIFTAGIFVVTVVVGVLT